MQSQRFWLIAGFLASAASAFGQLDTNSILIAASRTINLQPDQLVFGVTVNSDVKATLDDVLGALQGSGITAANLTSVYGGQVSLLAATTGSALQGLTLTFNVQNAQVSQRLQQPSQCPTADLVTEAQNQAKKLADAAGLSVGTIVALSDG